MLLSLIYVPRQSFISKVRGELCCCHSFVFHVNVSFISKVRVTGGPGGLCCCQSIVFNVNVSFI